MIHNMYDLSLYFVQELMGRPLRLKFSDKKADESVSTEQEEESLGDQT